MGLDPTFSIISGPRVVLEAVARRWNTLNGGGLFYDLNYGSDSGVFLNSRISPSQFPGIASQLEREALQDARVTACVVTLDLTSLGALRIRGDITLNTGNTSSLVLTIDAVKATPTVVFS